MAGIDEHEFQEPAGSPSYSSGGGGGPRVALIAIAIGGVVVLAVIAYFMFSGRTSPSRASATATPAAPQASKAAADEIEHIDLPPLDDSDALVRQRIGILSSNPLVAAWLGTSNLIRNFVVVVENISHGVNPSRHLRCPPTAAAVPCHDARQPPWSSMRATMNGLRRSPTRPRRSTRTGRDGCTGLSSRCCRRRTTSWAIRNRSTAP